MPVDKSFLLDLSPEFSTVDEARITRLVALAEPMIPSSKWGSKADLAVALYVAHLLTIGSTAGKGAVTSERIGDIERTYAASGSSNKDLESTAWGAQFKALGRSVLRGPYVT